MVLELDGKVAVVTGAGGGLGRAHALELARRGASVVVNDVSAALGGEAEQVDRAATVVAEIESAGGRAVADHSDVSTTEGGESLIGRAVEDLGGIDIVVNNAGILRDQAFHKTDPETVAAVFAVHLDGAFNVTRPAWKHMRDNGHGRVIMTSSSAGLFGNFGQSAYGAAKAGLYGLVRVLALEGKKYGITANAIAPMARTRMTEEFLGEEMAQALDPERVAPLVAYLAHDACELSGEVLAVGGGRVARVFVAMTPGWFASDLTAESVAENLDTVLNTDEFELLGSSGEELPLLQRFLEGDSR